MFKKARDQDGSAPASPLRIGEQQPIRSKNVSVIGPTLVFKGELSADEDLVIEGTIEGTIAHHKKNLTIGKKGRVIGNVYCTRIVMEDGARFNGKIEMAITAPLKVASDPDEFEEEFAEAKNMTA